MKAADTEEAYRKLLTIAIVAWNIALLPEGRQTEMIDKALAEGLQSASNDVEMGLRELVFVLIARKQAYFSEDTRTIVDFKSRG